MDTSLRSRHVSEYKTTPFFTDAIPQNLVAYTQQAACNALCVMGNVAQSAQFANDQRFYLHFFYSHFRPHFLSPADPPFRPPTLPVSMTSTNTTGPMSDSAPAAAPAPSSVPAARPSILGRRTFTASGLSAAVDHSALVSPDKAASPFATSVCVVASPLLPLGHFGMLFFVCDV